MLTDKCKIKFNNWLNSLQVAPYVVMFDDLPKIVQHAYLIEFFDSVGIIITHTYYPKTKRFVSKIRTNRDYDSTSFGNRKNTTDRAIEKANKIFNLK